VNEPAVLKLQCMIILLAQERKYETKTFCQDIALNSLSEFHLASRFRAGVKPG
jgi:hypothetical protein